MPEPELHFFDRCGGLTPRAVELGDLLKLPRFFTAAAFTECLQESFLRPSGLERHQCPLPPAAKTVSREAFYDGCRRWGYLAEVLPQKPLESYDALIVYALGVEGMCVVGNFLKNLLAQAGASSSPRIFLLTGSRPLTMEGEAAMAQHLRERHLPDTEEWAARLLFQYALKDSGRSFELINVPMRQGRDATGQPVWERPNTRDTLRAFFQQCRDPWDSLLALSLNPFVSYQHAVGVATGREQLGEEVFSQKCWETVGPLHPRFVPDRWASDGGRLIAILLDNFSRCAYEELGMLKTKGVVPC